MYVLTCKWFLGDYDHYEVAFCSDNIESLKDKAKKHIMSDMEDGTIPNGTTIKTSEINILNTFGGMEVYECSAEWDDEYQMYVVYTITCVA